MTSTPHTRGVVMFACNTPTVNYVEMAIRTARLVTHTLGLPVTLITDKKIKNDVFDSVIKITNTLTNRRVGQYKGGEEWKNGGRYAAYELSPYDETLLIDTDLLVVDKTMLSVMDNTVDYQILERNIMVGEADIPPTMGITSIPFKWATVIAFKKTKKAKQLFDMVEMIQKNYEYYCKLYQIDTFNFRNDYAFTIADHALNGYSVTNTTTNIPFSLLTIWKDVKSIELLNNTFIVKDGKKSYAIAKQNLHVIDKEYLLSPSFENLLLRLCV